MESSIEKLDMLIAAGQIKEAQDYACSLEDENEHDSCLIILSFYCAEKGMYYEADEAEAKLHIPLSYSGIG